MTRDPLAPAVIAEFLRSAMTTLRSELTALPDSVSAFHPAPGEWCAREVLGHLIEAERRGFAGRIRIILAGSTPRLETWDQNEVARARHDCERDSRALLDELGRMRGDSAALVRGLRRKDLERPVSTRRSAAYMSPISCRSGFTTTAITSSRSSPMCKRSCGRTWGTPRSSRPSVDPTGSW